MKKLILLISVFTTFNSIAGILIEPQLGYGISASKGGSFNNVSISSKATGVQYGSKLGYQFLGVMGGLNYQHASLSVESGIPSVNALTVKTSFKRDSLGVFAGYNLPILLRAWVGYNFSEKGTATETTTHFTNGDYFKGSSTELGLGFTGLPFLSINLIYKMLDYSKSYTSSSGQTASGALKPTEIVFAVSAPFNI